MQPQQDAKRFLTKLSEEIQEEKKRYLHECTHEHMKYTQICKYDSSTYPCRHKKCNFVHLFTTLHITCKVMQIRTPLKEYIIDYMSHLPPEECIDLYCCFIRCLPRKCQGMGKCSKIHCEAKEFEAILCLRLNAFVNSFKYDKRFQEYVPPYTSHIIDFFKNRK